MVYSLGKSALGCVRSVRIREQYTGKIQQSRSHTLLSEGQHVDDRRVAPVT